MLPLSLSLVAVVSMSVYVCGAGVASDSLLTLNFFLALWRNWCLSFEKGSHFSSRCAVPAPPCTTVIALRLVLWLRAARSGLMTIFFLAYHFDGKEKAVLFMKNCTTFTAPFETDLGYMFQLVLVTVQWSLGVYVCIYIHTYISSIHDIPQGAFRYETLSDKKYINNNRSLLRTIQDPTGNNVKYYIHNILILILRWWNWSPIRILIIKKLF